jgi:hypothetical protein
MKKAWVRVKNGAAEQYKAVTRHHYADVARMLKELEGSTLLLEVEPDPDGVACYVVDSDFYLLPPDVDVVESPVSLDNVMRTINQHGFPLHRMDKELADKIVGFFLSLGIPIAVEVVETYTTDGQPSVSLVKTDGDGYILYFFRE